MYYQLVIQSLDVVLVVRELSEVLLQRTLLGQELDVSTVVLDLTVLLLGDVLLSVQGSETPLLRDNDLLLTGELVSGSSQTLNDDGLVRVLGSDGHKNLTNVDSGSQTVGLTPGTSHTLLQSIGTSARQHLVNTQDVEGVDSDSQVEGVTTRHLGDVLVGANTGGFQSFGRKLLQLVGDHVDTQGEVVDRGLLTTKVVDSDLSVGDGSVESRLGEGLVLLVSVTVLLVAGGGENHLSA